MNEPATYTRKVRAIQYTATNRDTVLRFGAPRISIAKSGLLWAELKDSGTLVRIGDWVVRSGVGVGEALSVFTDSTFQRIFTKETTR